MAHPALLAMILHGIYPEIFYLIIIFLLGGLLDIGLIIAQCVFMVLGRKPNRIKSRQAVYLLGCVNTAIAVKLSSIVIFALYFGGSADLVLLLVPGLINGTLGLIGIVKYSPNQRVSQKV